jgi:hypothetical protein
MIFMDIVLNKEAGSSIVAYTGRAKRMLPFELLE